MCLFAPNIFVWVYIYICFLDNTMTIFYFNRFIVFKFKKILYTNTFVQKPENFVEVIRIVRLNNIYIK